MYVVDFVLLFTAMPLPVPLPATKDLHAEIAERRVARR
jgi:hypothetical protein